MSEMIERVARALAKNHGADPDALGPGRRHVIEIDGVSTIITDHMGPLWTMWTLDARAAIEAMREPTAAMISAGRGVTINGDPLAYPDCDDTWPAMIDAAIEGTSSS